MVQAWDHLERGDAAGARKLLESWQAEHRAQPEVLLLEAACDRTEGRLVQALAILQRLERDDPEWAIPPLWTAEILVDRAREGGVDPRVQLAEARRYVAAAVDRADDEDEYFDAVLLKAGIEIELDLNAEASDTLAGLPPPGVLANTPEFALEIASFHGALADREQAEAIIDAVVAHETDPELLAEAERLRKQIATVVHS